MTLFALALVLAAAVFHATWNLLAKRVGDGGPPFVWLFSVCSTLVFAPLAVGILLLQRPHLEPLAMVFMFGSGVLHIGYFLFLQRGYSVGDLSVVYPLARGTGPLLATVAAVVLLGERPGGVAVFGIVLIMTGVFLLTTEGGIRGFSFGKGAVYGLLTGCFIAAYTLVDKQAVSALLVPPVLQYWAANTILVVLLSPVGLRRGKEVVEVWRAHKLEVLGIAVLSPLSYILVLTALVFTPVSYVAPAREVSILIGAAMGARLLAERHTTSRLVAAGAMVLGIVALAFG